MRRSANAAYDLSRRGNATWTLEPDRRRPRRLLRPSPTQVRHDVTGRQPEQRGTSPDSRAPATPPSARPCSRKPACSLQTWRSADRRQLDNAHSPTLGLADRKAFGADSGTDEHVAKVAGCFIGY